LHPAGKPPLHLAGEQPLCQLVTLIYAWLAIYVWLVAHFCVWLVNHLYIQMTALVRRRSRLLEVWIWSLVYFHQVFLAIHQHIRLLFATAKLQPLDDIFVGVG
jgi:hypothetical protein